MIFYLLIKFSSFVFYMCRCFNNNYWFSLFNLNNWFSLFNFLRSYCSLKWIRMSFHNHNVAECTIIYTHIFDRSWSLLRWSRCLSAKAAEGIFDWCWNLSTRIIENILLSRCWDLCSVFFYYFIRKIHKFRLFGSIFFLLCWCNHFFLNWQIGDFKNLPIFIWR